MVREMAKKQQPIFQGEISFQSQACREGDLKSLRPNLTASQITPKVKKKEKKKVYQYLCFLFNTSVFLFLFQCLRGGRQSYDVFMDSH